MNVEFEQLSVNPGGTPQRIGPTHSSNEFPDRWINKGTSKLLLAAYPGPVQSATLPVPSKDRLGLYDEERLGPVPPDSRQHHPEYPIRWSELWPFARTIQDRELLTKGKIFEEKLLASLEEREKGGYGRLKQNTHGRSACLDGQKYSSISMRMI